MRSFNRRRSDDGRQKEKHGPGMNQQQHGMLGRSSRSNKTRQQLSTQENGGVPAAKATAPNTTTKQREEEDFSNLSPSRPHSPISGGCGVYVSRSAQPQRPLYPSLVDITDFPPAQLHQNLPEGNIAKPAPPSATISPSASGENNISNSHGDRCDDAILDITLTPQRSSSLKQAPSSSAALAGAKPDARRTSFKESASKNKKVRPLSSGAVRPVAVSPANIIKPPPPKKKNANNSSLSRSRSSSPRPPPPLFGRRSKNNSLEDDLPDAKRQQEQHSTFTGAQQEQTFAGARAKKPPSSLLDGDEDDDEECHGQNPNINLPRAQLSPFAPTRPNTDAAPAFGSNRLQQHVTMVGSVLHNDGGTTEARLQQRATSMGSNTAAISAAAAAASSATLYPTVSVDDGAFGNVASSSGTMLSSSATSPYSVASRPRAATSPTSGSDYAFHDPAGNVDADADTHSIDIDDLSDSKMPARRDPDTTAHAKKGAGGSTPKSSRFSSSEIEDAKTYACELLDHCHQESIDLEVLDMLLGMCKDCQERVKQYIEQSAEDLGTSLEDFFQLNDYIRLAIEAGERRREGIPTPKPTDSPPTDSTPTVKPSTPNGPENNGGLDIDVLVINEDIFSLICMLRAQQQERRLEAAWALMQFSRDADQTDDENKLRLRNEISSLGGMNSLLTLFRTRGTSYEVKVVVALAVAYLLPSFTDMSVPPSLGLKIMECLGLLSKQERKITPVGNVVMIEESFKASAKGLSQFWMDHLVPMLDSDRAREKQPTESRTDDPVLMLNRNVSVTSRSRNGRTAGGGPFDQRRESIELTELLEMTVSLIIHIAQPDAGKDTDNVIVKDYTLDTWRYALVLEQICAVEVARPIAVRQGILKILVNWIKSNDLEKIRPAAQALKHLTSIKDKYMAGWIHSQMVNEGALQGIVNLTHGFNRSVGHDVQLSVAMVLSSLCVAPHTRKAVVEANGLALLIQFICEHTDSPEGALFAGSALVKLAEGAITRASVFGDEDFELGFISEEKKADKVIEKIIESGAIESFVEIAKCNTGKLRSVAVEALRVFSEDISPRRQTRAQLCAHGAATALGVALRENVENNGELLQSKSSDLALAPQGSIKELHEALCALANILDPLPEGAHSNSPPQHYRQGSEMKDTHNVLINGCKQTTESGGLESLLFIASLPFVSGKEPVVQQTQRMSLVEETCRSLASMSPLLLTDSLASSGYSKWTNEILKALYKVLHQLETAEGFERIQDSLTEVQVNVFRALGVLATWEPLKVRIVDRFLPHLLQANTARDGTGVSDAANSAFQSLGFTDDEVAVQVAGNNPQLLADWFCLERSCLIQAMARVEIRQIIQDIWGVPFRETNDTSVTRLIREASDFSKSDDGSSGSPDLFDNFANDIETGGKRNMMLSQYRDIYGNRDSQPSPLLERVSGEAGEPDQSMSLLSNQIYPLNSSMANTDWVLDHAHSLLKSENKSNDVSSNPLSPHVENLLSVIFPSRIIRNHVLPIHKLRPGASFNFRGLMMPQRRYFSFRREGQLLSRLCATETASLDSSDVYWTLGFTNSSFAGEFSESLVQALYLCPMILGLSFSKTRYGKLAPRDSEKEKESKTEERSRILANLAGSLPPWINSLTFDGLLNDRDLNSLVIILETMGKLSASQDSKPASDKAGSKVHRKIDSDSACGSSAQGQGRFCFFAIRRSLQIREETWKSFFRLLGREDLSRRTPQMPLSSLKILDLSGNGLGDDLCASILHLVHDKDSCCRIEQLDLSGNCILAGARVQEVLNGYVDHHRGVLRKKNKWKSSLHTLYLSNNGLHLGKAWLELVSLLGRNALELRVLDLSSNGLILMDDEVVFCDVFASSLLKNTCLHQLNLSNNKLSSGAIDHILKDLSEAQNDSALAFLQLDGNSPPLNNKQRSLLSAFSSRSRKVLLQRFFEKRASLVAGHSVPGDELSNLQADEYTIPEEPDVVDARTKPRPSITSSITSNSPDMPMNNMITVLFSAPLVYTHGSNLCPFAKLDFGMERELMWQCLKEAARDIELSFDSATTDRFLAAMSKRCTCLHYSGHGHQKFLPFEDKGATHWFSVEQIRKLMDPTNESGGPSFRFVFVSACHSEQVGMTFASAGVPHVVCCQQESELKDTAALAFTRQFYLSLAVGNTVKESFDQGCKAVRATPNLRDAEKEMKKFRLLPVSGEHDVPIFNAKPVLEWPRTLSDKGLKANRRKSSTRTIRKGAVSGGASTSELSVRNMIQEDPSPSPPQFFLGREVDMYQVLRQILEKQLVSVVGEAGIGRSSLVCALCHYINERASTTLFYFEGIYYVKAKKDRRQNRSQALIFRLIQKLVEAGKLEESLDPHTDIETLSDVVCKTLKNEKALVVFDRVDLLEDSDETNEFPMFLSSLLRETRSVKVLITNRQPLKIPYLGEKAIELGPLNFGNTVRLFAFICPYVHLPTDRNKLFNSLMKATNEEAEKLLPTDLNLTQTTIEIFSVIGGGIPSQIEKAAYNITKEDFLDLMNGNILPSQTQESPAEMGDQAVQEQGGGGGSSH